MFEFKISTDKFSLPSDASEVTLGQFLKLREADANDHISQLSVLMNVNKEDINLLSTKYSKQILNAIKLTQVLIQDLQAFFESDVYLVPPKEVKLMDKIVRIPQDLQKEPFWPSRKVKEIIQDKLKETGSGNEFDLTDKAADVIAHYLYFPYTGRPYNEYQAEEFKEVILDLPITEAMPLATFFFLKWKPLYLTRWSCFLVALRIWRKKLALKYSINMKT